MFRQGGPLRATIISSDAVGMSLSRCPRDPDEVAEAYLMGLLPAHRRAEYEEHYHACPRYTERMESAQKVVIATRRAGRRLRQVPPSTR